MADYLRINIHGIFDPASENTLVVNPDGSLNLRPSAPYRANRAFAEVSITDTSVHTLLPAQPGEYADILQITFANTSASGVEVALSDGSQTIPIYCPANFTFGFINPDFFDEIMAGSAWTLQCVNGVTTLKAFAKFQLNSV